jgi:tape measure domain-containing protein
MQRIGLKAVLDVREFNKNSKQFVAGIDDMRRNVTRMSSSSKEITAVGVAVESLAFSWKRVAEILTALGIGKIFQEMARGIQKIIPDGMNAISVFQKLRIRFEALAARDYAREFGIPVAEAMQEVGEQTKELLGWIRQVSITTPFTVEQISNVMAWGQAFGFNVEQTKRLTLATGDFTAGMGLSTYVLERIIYNFGQMLSAGRVLGRELRDLANNFVPVPEIIKRMADEAGVSFLEMRKMMSEGSVSAEAFVRTFVDLAETDFDGAMAKMMRTVEGLGNKVKDFSQTLIGLELMSPLIDRITSTLSDKIDSLFTKQTLTAFALVGETLLHVYEIVGQSISGSLIPAFREFFQVLGIGAPTAMDVSAALLKIAIGMRFLIDMFSRGLSKVTEFVTSLKKHLQGGLGDIAQEAISWGANITISIAEGMARAISYIVQSLVRIAQVITSWLKPGSPPKLLPNLDWWGQQAMQVWLEGWGNADFKVFKDISDTVSGFLRALGKTNIPEVELIPRLLGTRAAISEAINMTREAGAVTSEALNKIYRAAGVTSDSMREYIRSVFELEAVTITTERAQRILGFTLSNVQPPIKIFGETVSNLHELREAALKLSGDLGIASRKYVNALFTLEDANYRVANAQKILNEVTSHYDSLLESLYAQQRQLDNELEEAQKIRKIDAALATGLLTVEEKLRLELEKRGILLRRQIRETEAERKAAVSAAQEKLDAEKEAQKAAEDAAELQKRIALELAREQLDATKEQASAAKALVEVQTENNRLLAEQLALLEKIAGRAGSTDPEDDDFDWITEPFDVESILPDEDEVRKAIEDLRKRLEEEFSKMIGKWKTYVGELAAPFGPLGTELSKAFTDISDSITEFVNSPTWELINAALLRFADKFMVAVGNVITFWDQNKDGFQEIVNYFGKRLMKELGIEGDLDSETIIGALILGLDNLGNSIVRFSEVLIEKGPTIQSELWSWMYLLFDVALPKLKEVWEWITKTAIPGIGDFAKALVKLAPVIVSLLPVIGALMLAFQAGTAITVALVSFRLMTWQVLMARSAFKTLQGIFGSLGGMLVKIALLAWKLAPIFAIIGAIATTVGLAIKDNFLGSRDVLENLAGVVKDILGPSFQDLKTAFAELMVVFEPYVPIVQGFLKIIQWFVSTVAKLIGRDLIMKFTTIVGVITALMAGIARGLTFFMNTISFIVGMAELFWKSLKDAWTSAWDLLKAIFAGNSEDMRVALVTWVKSILNLIMSTLGMILGFFVGIFGSIISFIWHFVKSAIDFFVKLKDRLVGNSIIPDMLKEIKNVFVTKLKEILTAVGNWIADVIRAIARKAWEFYSAGKDIIQKLLDGIKYLFTNPWGVISKVGEWILETVAKIISSENLKKFLEAGEELIGKVKDGIKDAFEKVGGVYTSIVEFITEAKNKVLTVIPDFLAAGGDLVQGLIDGINSNRGRFLNFIGNLIKSALGIGEREAEIKSPSKRTFRMGVNIVKGYVLGAQKEASRSRNFMRNVMNDLFAVPETMYRTMSNPLDGSVPLLQRGVMGTVSYPSATTTIVDRSIHVQVNPTYKNFQSEASVRYDISAALAHVMR